MGGGEEGGWKGTFLDALAKMTDIFHQNMTRSHVHIKTLPTGLVRLGSVLLFHLMQPYSSKVTSSFALRIIKSFKKKRGKKGKKKGVATAYLLVLCFVDGDVKALGEVCFILIRSTDDRHCLENQHVVHFCS